MNDQQPSSPPPLLRNLVFFLQRTTVFLCLIALALPTAAMTDAATAAGYDWVIAVDDPQNDHTGPNALAGGPVPGTFNHENDLLRVEVTDDAETFIIRVTTQTCTFDVPAGFALVIFELSGPGGHDWDASVAYDDGCANPRGMDIDSVLGDPDVPMPGLRFEADPANNQLYIFGDYAENGMVPGDAVAFDRVHTGRQFAGRYTFGMDEVIVPAFAVGSGAASASADPKVVVGNATMPLQASFDAPTSEVHELAWDSPYANATFDMEVRAQHGAVNVTVLDSGNSTVFSRSLGNESGEPTNDLLGTTASLTHLSPGAWTLRVTYTNFTGELRFSITEYQVHVPATPPEAPEPVGDDNGTAEPSLDAAIEEDAPGPALPLLVLGLLATVGAVRRRR